MATDHPNSEHEHKGVDEDLDRLQRSLEHEEASGADDGPETISPSPHTDESGAIYVGREFTPEQFAAWFRVQGLGAQPFNAVGIHHTGIPTAATWNGVATLNGVFRWYNTPPPRGPSDGPWPWGRGPHLWLYDGTGSYRPGESLVYVGTHPAHDGIGIAGRNYRWLHVEAIGNFDQARMPPAMEDLYRFVLQVICGDRIPIINCVDRQVDGPITPLGLLFHRDAPGAGKSCPGWETRADWFFPSMGRRADAPQSGWHQVAVDIANIRQGPGRGFPVAGSLARDVTIDCDEVTPGELVGDSVWWLHLRDGRGWVHASLLRPIMAPAEAVSVESSLLAAPRATLAQAQRYLLSRPHGVYRDDDVRWIARLYFETAQPVGLDPLVAIAQMAHETDFLASEWSQPPRRNPAGIGVTGQAGAGIAFPDWRSAVRAHVGRLLAYALPTGGENDAQRALIEEALGWRPLPARYRGCAPTLAGLAGSWAVDRDYAGKLVAHANRARATPT